MADNTCNGLATWVSVPDAPATTANLALLNAAKALLQGIYTYTQGTPDYCPSSYTHFNTRYSSYLVHSENNTYVYWPCEANAQTQIVWSSEPGTDPRGWSGTVTASGSYPVSSQHPAKPAMCVTDCSGFITSLFTYANQQVKTVFGGWRQGEPNTIPEAGCFDPGPGSQDCRNPNSANYYRFFTEAGNEFRQIALADIQPGDLLAWANTAIPPGKKEPLDSGHIMLVVAVADEPSDPSGQSKQVVVADESSGHTLDSRGNASGLGLGIVVLSTRYDNELTFYWTVENFLAQPPKPQPGKVALGRAIAA